MNLKIVARIAAERVRSLIWEADTLVDWAAGGTRFKLDGTVLPRAVSFSFRFDAACGSPSGTYAVIYELLGTKGVILKNGEILREINRSFYFANAYEYPMCIARLESGREVLIYCPEDYNRLEIDDLETGERLTTCDERKPADFFHSRLAIDPNSSHFLSAGWIWHPMGGLGVYRLDEAVRNPTTLDELGLFRSQFTEISSAAFIDDHHVVISTTEETFADEEDFASGDVLRPNSIAVWNLVESRIVSQVQVAAPAGTLMALDSKYVVDFYDHPKVIDIRTGQVVASLDDVKSGTQNSSIIHHIERPPPLALDPQHRRFALATPTEILVVQVESE